MDTQQALDECRFPKVVHSRHSLNVGFCPPETSNTPTCVTLWSQTEGDSSLKFLFVYLREILLSFCGGGGGGVICFVFCCFVLFWGVFGETKKRVDKESTQSPKDSFGQRDRKKCIQNKGDSEGKSIGRGEIEVEKELCLLMFPFCFSTLRLCSRGSGRE